MSGDYSSNYSGYQVDKVVEKGLASLKAVEISGTSTEMIAVPFEAVLKDFSSTSSENLVDALDDKQDVLAAGENITITDNTISASTGIPTQEGQSGKFLSTDGTDVSWQTVDALPIQTGQSGKFLSTNGSYASWQTVDALPTQTGQSGKFLTTDGSSASWDEVFPDQTGQAEKYLTTDGTDVSWGSIEKLPSKSGNAGKFLMTNGTTTSWESTATFPTQTGQSGKFLTTDGSSVSWGSVDALPSQTGNAGKYLGTNGTMASWNGLGQKFSTTLAVVSSNPDLTIQNSYSGTKDTLGTETETLTYTATSSPTWVQSLLPSSGSWDCIGFGGGKFVALKTGSCAYSADGITWTEVSTGLSYLPSIIYGNGKFVATGNSGSCAYSTDGETWTAGTMPNSKSWYVTFGDGKFVAVSGTSSTGAYSTDGITWVTSNMPSSQNWHSVVYGNGKFVAIASGSDVCAYSTDGITWVASNMPSSQSWYSVTYGNGKFVATVSSSSVCAYSTDGITWTASNMPSSQYWWGLAYGGGSFVSVAFSYSSSGTNIYAYSTDGITWTQGTMPISARWWGLTYGNNRFVTTADNSSNSAYMIMGTWQNSSSETVQLSDYQLSITSGTPATNDTLSLTYTTTSVNSVLNFWTGNATQYGNITTKDSNTQYNVTGKGLYLGDTEIIANKLSVSGNTNATSVDGQWVESYLVLTTATAVGTYTIDLSSYLPNDGYNYEIIITGYGQRAASSSNAIVGITSDLNPNTLYLGSSHTGQIMSNSLITFVKQYVYIEVTNADFDTNSVRAIAYRRIGTNS